MRHVRAARAKAMVQGGEKWEVGVSPSNVEGDMTTLKIIDVELPMGREYVR